MLTIVRATRRFLNSDGTPFDHGGRVTVSLTAALTDAWDGAHYPVASMVLRIATPDYVSPRGAANLTGSLIGPDGEAWVNLVATDDPHGEPQGARWQFVEQPTGARSARYTVPIPYDAPVDPVTGARTIDVGTLTPSAGGIVYIAVPGPPGSGGGGVSNIDGGSPTTTTSDIVDGGTP